MAKPKITYGQVSDNKISSWSTSEVPTERVVAGIIFEPTSKILLIPENTLLVSNTSGTHALRVHYTTDLQTFITNIVDTGVIEETGDEY